MSNRSAFHTIKGYFYQFDLSILSLMNLKNDTDFIVIEGVEDIDLGDVFINTAIQCKYYESTEYNHSVIGGAIRFMFEDFIDRKNNEKDAINYYLYGYYKSGHEKLPSELSADFIKEHFLTHIYKGKKIFLHEDLEATDLDLKNFINKLNINNNADEYSKQLENIMKQLREHFGCKTFEADYYYYNNAIRIIKEKAIQSKSEDRKITKKEFLNLIDNKEVLFNEWYHCYRSEKEVFRNLRKEFFSHFNLSPFERFFLIEINEDCSRSDIKDIIYLISKKWAKISKKEEESFCPYIYMYNLADKEILFLKNELFEEGFSFIDGFPYRNSNFQLKSICQQVNYENNIKIKIIDDIGDMDELIESIKKRREVYQFFIKDSFYINENPKIKHIKIQIKKLSNVKEII